MHGPRSKFTNRVDNVVDDHLFGCVIINKEVEFHHNNKRVLVRSDIKKVKDTKVTVVCGGGSGHEPFATGFVGPNGLTSAVSGDIYASPSAQEITDAIKIALSTKGTIVFSNNYTGDRLNFGMAVENIKTSYPQHKIKVFFIDDDVSLEQKNGFQTGHRGLAGTVLILQAAGVWAEKGMGFEEIVENVEKMIFGLGTFGVSLYPCSMPGKDYMFKLPECELELGLGIHGEPGLERMKITTAKKIIQKLMPKLAFSQRLGFRKEDDLPVVILLNNLGTVSQLEMNILTKEILDWIALNTKLRILALFRGPVTSSIDGHGVSISVLKLTHPVWLPTLLTFSPISKFWHVLSRNIITFQDVHMVNSPGCTVSGDVLVECDGTEREVSAEEKLALDYYKETSRKWHEDLDKLLGQSLNHAPRFALPDYPQFPPICKSCST